MKWDEYTSYGTRMSENRSVLRCRLANLIKGYELQENVNQCNVSNTKDIKQAENCATVK